MGILPMLVKETGSPEPSSSAADTINELERWRGEAERAARDQVRLWRENIQFIESIQYAARRGDLVFNVQAAVRSQFRQVDNRLLAHARRLHARLSQVRYAPSVTADSTEPGDEMAARTAAAALRWFDRRKRVRTRRRQANWWLVACAEYYLEPYWDSQSGPVEPVPEVDEVGNVIYEDALGDDGQPLSEVDEMGQPQMDEMGMPVFRQRPRMKLEPVGEPDFAVWSPFQVLADPSAMEWEKVRWVFVEEWVPREDIFVRFPVCTDEEIPSGQRIQMAPWIPPVISEIGDTTGLPKPQPPVGEMVRVVRFYERPSGKYADGRTVIYTGSKILYEGPVGTPRDRSLPLVKVHYIGRPWRQAARAPVDAAKPLQALYVRMFSRYAEHLAKMPIGWLLVPATSRIPRRALTSEVGSIIRYLPGGGVPQFVFPPFQGLQWYERILLRLESSMEELMALPPATRGQLPRGARAARTVELLQEAADAVQAPVLEDMAEGWTQFFEKVLLLMDEHMQVPRLLSIVGADRMPEVVEFKGGLLPRDWRDRLTIAVEAGESLPATKLMRMELILTLAARHGFFGQVGTPEYRQALAAALDLDAGFLQTEEDLDRKVADVENLQILRGEPVEPSMLDNSLVHLRAHLTAMRRLQAAGRRDEAGRFERHILAHKEVIQRQVAEMKGLEEPKPEEGGTPSLVPPPPGGEQPLRRNVEDLTDQLLTGPNE